MEEKPILNPTLSNKRRDLMHRVMDGETDLAGTMHILNGYKFCDNFLIWMIAHKWTGKNLKEIIIKQFHSSIPSLVNYIVEAAKTPDARKVT